MEALGFLLLTLHWFNPLMWIAYILLCRDIELACDEKVIKELGSVERADYTQALVACSVNRRMIAACPLAFGEVGVKERVKSVMNYKKPAFWIILFAIVVCVTTAVCFLTDPKVPNDNVGITYYYGTVTDQAMSVIYEGSQESREYISLHCDNGEDLQFWASEPSTSAPAMIGKHVMVRSRIEESTGLRIMTKIAITDNTWAYTADEAIENAILDFNWSSRYEGMLQCADFVLLSSEAGGPAATNEIDTEIFYGLALHQVFTVKNGELEEKGGSHIPTVLTFAIDEAGRYIITEYWEPRDGSYYTSDIKEKFPAFVWPDTQKYIEEQKERNIAKASGHFGLTIATDDGYVHAGVKYQYKLELTGKFPNSDVETTFVVLTNREHLTFDMVVKSMVSSNSEDIEIANDYVLLTQPYDWGISLSVKNVSPTGLTIVCNQSGGNFSSKAGPFLSSVNLTTGSYFWLEKLVDGAWTELPVPEDLAWTTEAYVIPLDDSTMWNVNWSNIYGSLEAGQYRIGKTISFTPAPGESESQAYYAEFTIN